MNMLVSLKKEAVERKRPKQGKRNKGISPQRQREMRRKKAPVLLTQASLRLVEHQIDRGEFTLLAVSIHPWKLTLHDRRLFKVRLVF